ncbi:hypothetical protein JCM11251_007179 [Rhodosporidiobolus azoricus]
MKFNSEDLASYRIACNYLHRWQREEAPNFGRLITKKDGTLTYDPTRRPPSTSSRAPAPGESNAEFVKAVQEYGTTRFVDGEPLFERMIRGVEKMVAGSGAEWHSATQGLPQDLFSIGRLQTFYGTNESDLRVHHIRGLLRAAGHLVGGLTGQTVLGRDEAEAGKTAVVDAILTLKLGKGGCPPGGVQEVKVAFDFKCENDFTDELCDRLSACIASGYEFVMMGMPPPSPSLPSPTPLTAVSLPAACPSQKKQSGGAAAKKPAQTSAPPYPASLSLAEKIAVTPPLPYGYYDPTGQPVAVDAVGHKLDCVLQQIAAQGVQQARRIEVLTTAGYKCVGDGRSIVIVTEKKAVPFYFVDKSCYVGNKRELYEAPLLIASLFLHRFSFPDYLAQGLLKDAKDLVADVYGHHNQQSRLGGTGAGGPAEQSESSGRRGGGGSRPASGGHVDAESDAAYMQPDEATTTCPVWNSSPASPLSSPLPSPPHSPLSLALSPSRRQETGEDFSPAHSAYTTPQTSVCLDCPPFLDDGQDSFDLDEDLYGLKGADCLKLSRAGRTAFFWARQGNSATGLTAELALDAQLGAGFSGAVWSTSSHELALKVIPRCSRDAEEDEDETAPYRDGVCEENVYRVLDHTFGQAPGRRVLPTFFGSFEDSSVLILVLEWMEGSTFSSWADLAKKRSDVSHSLDQLHSLPITHGDLRPANFLLSTDGRIRLCDLGRARCYRDASSAATFQQEERACFERKLANPDQDRQEEEAYWYRR